ncbi:hypothetical protein [Streptomyces sp. NPDC088554]|uniref:hypothetical protein n=1 Tax=Streptomyces sp. NPDC088554 TaxID=3365865 RepID=UPI0037FFE565
MTSSSGTDRPARDVRRGRLPRLVGAAVLTALATLSAGCGIRTTSIPVDAGSAPSRLPCETSGNGVITQSQPGVPVRVYLLCASGLSSVERTARIPTGDGTGSADGTVGTSDSRLRTAQGLLDELLAQPSAIEREAGFSTSVRGPLIVSAAHRGDPAGTLRLSRQPEDLPMAALAQIVCTLTESEATDGQVVLGGPGAYPPREYACDQETKSHPDKVIPTVAPATPSTASPAPTSAP